MSLGRRLALPFPSVGGPKAADRSIAAANPAISLPTWCRAASLSTKVRRKPPERQLTRSSQECHARAALLAPEMKRQRLLAVYYELASLAKRPNRRRIPIAQVSG